MKESPSPWAAGGLWRTATMHEARRRFATTRVVIDAIPRSNGSCFLSLDLERDTHEVCRSSTRCVDGFHARRSADGSFGATLPSLAGGTGVAERGASCSALESGRSSHLGRRFSPRSRPSRVRHMLSERRGIHHRCRGPRTSAGRSTSSRTRCMRRLRRGDRGAGGPPLCTTSGSYHAGVDPMDVGPFAESTRVFHPRATHFQKTPATKSRRRCQATVGEVRFTARSKPRRTITFSHEGSP
jgi:hypothetical protein